MKAVTAVLKTMEAIAGVLKNGSSERRYIMKNIIHPGIDKLPAHETF